MSPQLTPKRSFGRLGKKNHCDRADGGNHIDSKKLFCSTGSSITFYVKQTVPERAKLIEDIESHGGKVVEEFNDAQFVLADPNKTQRFVSGLRQVYSYKLVIDSIQTNQFQRAADYKLLITGERNGRRPFTQQDDRFLEEYLKGKTVALKGNKIYQELEKMNDRHTWQSWRNRAELVIIPNMEIQRKLKKQNEVEPSTNTSTVSECIESPFFTDLDDQATEQVLNSFLEKIKENDIIIDISDEEDNNIPEVDNEKNTKKSIEDSSNVETTLNREKPEGRISNGDTVRTPVKLRSRMTPIKETEYEEVLGSSLSSLGKRSQVDMNDIYDLSETPRRKPFASLSSQGPSIENDVISLDSPEITLPESPNSLVKQIQEQTEEETEVETPCPVSSVRLGKRRQIQGDETPTNSQSKRLRLSSSSVRSQVPSPFKASGFPIQPTNECDEKDEREFLAKVKEISEITHRPLTSVIRALGETTCNFEVAKDFLINGRTANNSRFIWTSEEDAIITSGSDKEKLREIVNNHGTEVTKDRMDFLQTYVTHH
ncbi:15987_t:CDS:2 [Acaulospora colombiana]|uniref:15987_t:CDS:1 n=1 Tax=Acaulospora colombiana TaxID=27376 RepID=A0ACA9LDW5_9GLOM|nr:15987_t:CDS:2 [Acaulospora colombiana]